MFRYDNLPVILKFWSYTAAATAVLAFFASPVQVVKAVRLLPNDQRLVANELLSSIVQQQRHEGGNNNNNNNNNNNVTIDPQQQQQQQQQRHRMLAGPVTVPMPNSPDDHLVTNLPLLAEGTLPTQHWAGLLPASPNGDKYLFYWLFAPDMSSHNNDFNNVQEADIPLVIWLNGGPGCSSMDGLFLENGPLRFQQKESDGNYQLVAAQHSWHRIPAYTVYIDQPVGTGLSFTTSRKYPKNDLEVNQDFYYFLQSFLKTHSDKFVQADNNSKLHRKLYFSGESHAGHYIPSMMAYILDQNEAAAAIANPQQQIYIPLAGAAIGNGWVDPFHQYAAAEAAYGHGIIGRAQVTALDEKEKECQKMLNQKRYASTICFNLLDDIVGQSYGSKSTFKVSQYDVRKVESRRGARTFPPGHKTVETYLGHVGSANGITAETMNSALAALHATPSRQAGQVYQECTNPPYDALSHQDGLGVVDEVVKILEHNEEGGNKIRLLFFNGVTDLICNHVGNEIMLEKLPWKNNEQYIRATRSAWKSKLQQGDKISGYIKEFENLLYLKVMDSGHMVPMDVPDVALDMMRLFLYGGENAFQYSPQHLDRAIDAGTTTTSEHCETCPVCPSTNATNEIAGTTTDGGTESGVDGAVPNGGGGGNSSAGKAKIGVGLALVSVILVSALVMLRRSRYSKHSSMPAYDLEMRGGTYFDDPAVDGGGGSGNGNLHGGENGGSSGKFH